MNEGNTAGLIVKIHSESITGPVIGISSTTTIPAVNASIATFNFGSVQLVPQNLYVIDIIQASAAASVGDFSSPSYPLGSMIIWGEENYGVDIWFREGIYQEAALEGLSWGSIKSTF